MNHSANDKHDGHGAGIDVHAALQKAGVIGIWEYRVAEGRVYTDHAMAMFYGVEPDEANSGTLPATFRKAIHPDDVNAAVSALRYAVATGTDYRVRYRVIGDDSVARLIEVQAKAHVADGHTVSLTGVNIEVSRGERSWNDLLHELAETSTKAASIAAEMDDPETAYFAQMLLIQVGEKLAKRMMGHGR